MKKFKMILNIAFIAATLLFISCGSDDDGKEQISVQNLVIAIDENPTNGETIGTVQVVGSGASGFSITSQTPSGALNIVASTGELTVADATLFDFETNPVITATILVDGAANTGTVTVNLNNINELNVQDLNVTIDENPTNGESVGTVQADGDGSLSFSITSQTPSGALNVDESTGELTVADTTLFDFETNPVITATISVDNTVNTVTSIVTINLNDIAESATIGDYRDGGIVFWVDPTDITHGLVCATVDQSTGVHWYNGTYTITGATGTAIGTGKVNTTAIVNNQGAGTYAAQLCNDLSLNGYSDWYLPSKDELTAVYMNVTTINATAVSNGLGSLSTSKNYWSSTETANNVAFGHNFNIGVSVHAVKNHNGYYVRAIRAY